jgi:hypothetical protein
MGKAEKQWERLQANQKGWRYDQLARILERYGFTCDIAGTSHRVFKHPSGRRCGLVDAGSGTLLPVYAKEVVAAVRDVLALDKADATL